MFLNNKWIKLNKLTWILKDSLKIWEIMLEIYRIRENLWSGKIKIIGGKLMGINRNGKGINLCMINWRNKWGSFRIKPILRRNS